jgi:hypothetical protein
VALLLLFDRELASIRVGSGGVWCMELGFLAMQRASASGFVTESGAWRVLARVWAESAAPLCQWPVRCLFSPHVPVVCTLPYFNFFG